MDEVEIFFCQFPHPWALRVSGMGCYTSKCEKSQNHCTLMNMQQDQQMQQEIICRRIKRFNMETGVVNHEFQVLMEAPGSRDTRRKLVLSVRNFK
jgi:hypothetical protein